MNIRISNGTKYRILLAFLIISIWAFNEIKILTYPIKILYIFVFGYDTIKFKRKIAKYQIWCLVMMLLSALAALIAPNLVDSINVFINMLQVFLIGFVTYGYLDNEKKIEDLLYLFIWGGILLTIRLVIKTPLDVWLSWERLGEAIGSNPNDVGNKAAFSAIIALGMTRRFVGKRKIGLFAAFGVLSAIVLFSGSRKALIAVVAAVILMYTIGLKNKKKLIFSVIAICVFLAAGYKLIMTNSTLYGTIGRRIETMINVFFYGGSEAHSIDLRERYISIAWELIKKNPILGIGLGAFGSVSGIGVYSHCDYTEVACSYGLIGAFIYYLPLLVYTLRYLLLKRKSQTDYICFIMQCILLLTYVTMVMYTSAYVQVLISLFAAHYRLVTVNRRRINTRTDEVSVVKINEQN